MSRSGARLNGRAMFQRGLKRHSYQLWEVKFQCPAKESAAETEQRLSSQLARYILPSRGPSYPLPAARCPNLRPRRRTQPILLPPPPSSSSLLFSPLLPSSPVPFSLWARLPPASAVCVSSGRFLVQIKLIFEGPTLFSYEFHIGARPRDPWNGDVFTCRHAHGTLTGRSRDALGRSRDARLHPGQAAH